MLLSQVSKDFRGDSVRMSNARQEVVNFHENEHEHLRSINDTNKDSLIGDPLDLQLDTAPGFN